MQVGFGVKRVFEHRVEEMFEEADIWLVNDAQRGC